jgi:hypothetical protein
MRKREEERKKKGDRGRETGDEEGIRDQGSGRGSFIYNITWHTFLCQNSQWGGGVFQILGGL